MTIRKGAAARLTFLFILLCLASVACTDRETTWDRVQSSGALHFGLDPTYPPFELFDGTNLIGLDVDLAHAIASDKGLTAQFSHFGFDGLYDALATHQVDVLVSALPADISRTRDFAYSDGYFDSGLVLVSPADQVLDEPAALVGATVAVELGAAGHVHATMLQRQVADLQVITGASSDEVLQALNDGLAQVAIVDNVAFRLFAQPESGAALVASHLTSEPYVFVVRRQDQDLLDEINDSLARLRDNGRLDTILNTWLQG